MRSFVAFCYLLSFSPSNHSTFGASGSGHLFFQFLVEARRCSSGDKEYDELEAGYSSAWPSWDIFGSATMPTMLTLDQMKAFVRSHFEDFVNKRNAAVIRTNMTPEFYDHDGPGGKPAGVEADEKMMLAMYKSMPDLRLEIEDMIAEGDKVMCRNIWRWTDTTSGKKMQFHGFVLWRFEGDKIAERWATVTPPAEGGEWTKR
jgi:predicted ester cyclase